MNSKKQFSKNILGTFTSKGFSMVFRLLILILISHSLGKVGKGEISIINTNMMLLALIINFVGGSVSSNLSAKYSLKSYLLPGLLWALVISFLSIPIFLYLKVSNEISWLTAVSALAMCWFNQIMGSLMGRKKVLIRNILSISPIFMWMVYLFWAYQNHELSVENYLYSFAIFHFFAFIVGLYFLVKSEKNGMFIRANIKEVLQKGFLAQLAHFVMFFNYRLPFYVIEFYIGKGALGIFNNAVIVGENTRQLSNSIATVQHMEIVNATGTLKHIEHTSIVLKKIALFSISLLLIPLFFSHSVWEFIFGPDFGDIAQLYPILFPGMLFLSLSSVYSSFFHGTNDFTTMIKANLVGLFFMVIALYLGFVKHELLGASVAVSIAYITNFFYYVWKFKKKTNCGFFKTMFFRN